MKMFAHKHTGFTLVEIMIAVAIIGILTAIAIPAFLTYRQKSYDTSAVSDLKHLEIFEQVFYNDYNQFVPIALTDKAANGVISKTVVINGQNIPFVIQSLTPANQILAKTDASNQYLNLGAHHPAGRNILAIESDSADGVRYKSFIGIMQASDLPNATAGADLATWPLWK